MQMKIDKNNVEDILALTPMQEGMLFLYLNASDSRLYFEQLCLEITGAVDVEILKKAWQFVVDTNEMLRTIYRWEKLQKPVQVVLKNHGIPIREYDLSEANVEEKDRLLKELREREQAEKVDISSETCKVTLCRLEKEKYGMIVNRYQILYDGWSNGILLKELVEAYNALSSGGIPSIKTKGKYKEYVKWIQDQDKEKQQRYWRNYLKGFDTKTALPFDRRGKSNDVDSKSYSYAFTHEFSNKIIDFTKRNEVTLASLLYAAWGILLQKYNNSDDVVFGITISGRPAELQGIQEVMGLFINTLPLRVNSSPAESARNLMGSIMEELGERVEYESTSLLDIKRCSTLDPMDNMFDSVMILENYPLDKSIQETSSTFVINAYSIVEPTNFDLTIQVMLLEAIEVNFIYNSNVFKIETIRRIAEHFRNVLEHILHFPDAKLSEIEVLSSEEKKQLIFEFNNTGAEYPKHQMIHELFEEQAERVPHKVAAVFKGKGITYQELNQSANRLARMLIDHGVGKETIVGLYVPRSLEMIIGILGILKANAICLPLDIDHPASRTDMILEDSEARLLLQTNEAKYKGSFDGQALEIDSDRLDTYDSGNIQNKASSDSTAYIIYTSGSTGKPKGAMLHHYGIINHVLTKNKELEITQDHIVGNNFSVNVVASIWQILSPLLLGATLVIYSEDIENDPYEQFNSLSKDDVNIIEVIPSVLNAYIGLIERGKPKIDLPSLKKIALTSEETKVSLVEKFFKQYSITLVDCYGQTECCDDTLHYSIKGHKDMVTVPIGKPSLNTRAYIVDRNFRLQPVGVAGELCISGDGVGKGYWKRPELTSEKFVENPIEPGRLMYRTGDLARWREDGNVEYLGRIDHQVKIRGNRIELGEIESKLLKHEDIESAAVICRVDDGGNNYLNAYLVTRKPLSISQLRAYLAAGLPDYMVPSHFVQLDKMPLTPNGKIDRKALPLCATNMETGVEFALPKNEIEKQLLEIWKRMLKLEKVGVKESFYELGGNSLMMVQVHAEISELFPGRVTVQDLFTYPTIAKLAEFIMSQTSEDINLQLKKIELPEEYFNHGKAGNQVFTYQYVLENNFCESLARVSEKEHTDRFDMLLCLYIYLLSQISKAREIAVQTIFDDPGRILPIEMNMEEVHDFSEMFIAVGIKKTEMMAYGASELGKMESVKDHQRILPCFYKRSAVTAKTNWTEFFDIALGVESSGSKIVLTCEYGGKLLDPEKIKSMFNSYINLIKRYLQKYNFSS